MKVTVIIPTYNAGTLWQKWIETYQNQSLKADQVIVIDSSSTDQTAVLAEQAGFFVKKIAKSEFSHGKTRNVAVALASTDSEILVFLTQDALLSDSRDC